MGLIVKFHTISGGNGILLLPLGIYGIYCLNPSSELYIIIELTLRIFSNTSSMSVSTNFFFPFLSWTYV